MPDSRPHHDVGVSDDPKVRNMEYKHHGDALVPRQQRFGLYTRSLIKGLGIPVENRHGLRPLRDPETKKLGPLSIKRDFGYQAVAEDVTTFNFHMHLPHYAVIDDDTEAVRVLARQWETQNLTCFSGCLRAGPCRRRALRGFDYLQHAVRRGRKPAQLLEEHFHGEVRPYRRIDKPFDVRVYPYA
jgi:hypothetical protein